MNWQTYRNEEYGFEFRYPQNYKTVIPGLEQGGWPNAVILVIPQAGSQSYHMAVEVWSGEEAIPAHVKLDPNYTQWNKGGRFITASNPNEDPVVEQILSTFKFTE